MNEPDPIGELSAVIVGELIEAGKSVSVAESCTGGWIAKALTDINGSSQCFGYGVVTYSNGAKESMLGVKPESLNEFGAVSEQVVREMAAGILQLSGADYAVAVSGVAGPGGGSSEKPVGTVWIAWAGRDRRTLSIDARKYAIAGDREAVREGAVILAMQGIRERMGDHG